MKKICVKFQKPGIHCYPSAPEDVSYLRSPHRHLFQFKVCIEVKSNDRDIEFHQFLGWLTSLYDQSMLELNDKSCETISDDLARRILEQYPERVLTIEVWEDGECGSVADYS